jgi:hypothetical protein
LTWVYNFQIWDYILHIENLECHHSFSRGGVKGVLQPQHGKGKGKGKSVNECRKCRKCRKYRKKWKIGNTKTKSSRNSHMIF